MFKKPSKSLCIYFWQIIGAMFAYAFFTMAIMMFVALVIIMITIPSFAVWAIFTHGFENALNEGYAYRDEVGLGVFFLIVYLFAGICKLIAVVWRKISRIEPEPNIATEYIRAKKEKVCPRIEFK